MLPKAFIDSSVFILGKEWPNSNSAKILELLSQGKVEAVVSSKVVHEVFYYFKNHHGKSLASDYRFFLVQFCTVIDEDRIRGEINQWKDKIKKKDVLHLATVKAFHLPHLVAFDRDFKPFPEYVTPKAFLKLLGRKTAATEY